MEDAKDAKEAIIKTVYDKDQSWIRHYNGLIMQINSISIGGSSAVIAYFITVRWSAPKPSGMFSLLLTAPLAITGFAVWSTHTIIREMQSVFARLIRIETHWQLYEKGAVL